MVIIPSTEEKFIIPKFVNNGLYSGYSSIIDIESQTCEITSWELIDPIKFKDHYCEYKGTTSIITNIFKSTLMIAIILVIFLETLIIIIINIKNIGQNKVLAINIIIAVSIVNLLTLPLFWYAFPKKLNIIHLEPKLFVPIIEIVIIIIESIFYKVFLRVSYKKAIIISVIANAISYLAGEIIF